ncbi:MAG: putative lipid II flippase FtsW [Anaerosomatales bacterium]|nr:putative lipid II flippase FtsW [Anaerosomatales bacterium]MDT8433248.1 putative lipid II flippase FtsW [Anaerosomatales bacterium]
MKEHTRYAGGPLPRYLMLGSMLFLLFGGMVMVYSASSVADFVNLQDSAYHLRRQAIGALAGGVALVVAMSLDYRKARWAGPALWGVSVLGLLLVVALGVGKWGATRWLDLGPFTVQPSEFAKLGCVMVAALLLQQYRSGRIDRGTFWRRVGLVVGVVVVLVMLQPDLGTTIAIVLSVYLALLIGGVSLGLLGGVALGGLAGIAGLVMIAPYRMRRITSFLDPFADPQGSGYQSIQALYAFGSGGLDGVGLGMSRQKFFYLPAAHTDFIFAIIGEELGLIGALSVVAAFAVIAYAGVRIALGARDGYGRVLAGGLTAMLVTQAVINMGAVTGLLPVTGIPMPLVSSGGSSMIFTMLCIGIILSVSTYGGRAVRRERSGSRETAGARSAERRGDRRSHLSSVDGGRSVARRRA